MCFDNRFVPNSRQFGKSQNIDQPCGVSQTAIDHDQISKILYYCQSLATPLVRSRWLFKIHCLGFVGQTNFTQELEVDVTTLKLLWFTLERKQLAPYWIYLNVSVENTNFLSFFLNLSGYFNGKHQLSFFIYLFLLHTYIFHFTGIRFIESDNKLWNSFWNKPDFKPIMYCHPVSHILLCVSDNTWM